MDDLVPMGLKHQEAEECLYKLRCAMFHCERTATVLLVSTSSCLTCFLVEKWLKGSFDRISEVSCEDVILFPDSIRVF